MIFEDKNCQDFPLLLPSCIQQIITEGIFKITGSKTSSISKAQWKPMIQSLDSFRDWLPYLKLGKYFLRTS